MDTQQLKRVLEAQRDLYLRLDDKVIVVVTTSFQEAPIETVLQRDDHEVVRIPDASRPGQKYNLDEALFSGKTLGWIISNVSLSHSIGAEMIKHNMFIVSNPGITDDWLYVLDPFNTKACPHYADKIEEKIGGDIGGEIHVIADDGTDLVLKVPNGNWN
ncbi:hypothetical protein KKC65_03565 [Patescibacteria group bacterium]|nr:hypothetical protein [Patescibacteria group bacterium]